MLFFISFLSGVFLFYSFAYFPFISIFAFLFSSVFLSLKKKFFLLLIILSGIAFAFLKSGQEKDISSLMDREIIASGVFQSYPLKTERGFFKQSLYIQSAVDEKTGEKIEGLAGQEVTVLSDREFSIGTEGNFLVKTLRYEKRLNPGAFVTDQVYAQLLGVHELGNKKTSPSLKIQELRYRLNKYITENFKKDSASFLSAITVGQTASIDEGLRNAFNVTGLAHILSISGTHFGLFSIFLFGIFRIFIKLLPYKVLQRITIFLTPSQVSAVLCLPFMLAYLGLSGGSIPAVRSFIMIGLFLLGLLIGRKGFWLNSLLFAAFVLVLWEPKVILDLSFQLSFLAVLFIGFSLKTERGKKTEESELAWETGFPKRMKRVFRYIGNALLLTLSASIGTAPLIAYHFHYLSIISPLSNLLVTPFIGFILLPLAIFSSFLFCITGHYVFTPVVSVISDTSIALIRFLSDFHFADVKVPVFPIGIVLLFYGGFLFYFLPGKKRYNLIIPFVPILIYFSLLIFERKELIVTFLDVGQGDSSVVELPDRKTIIIDTGRGGRETALFLTYRGKKVIDAIILSHVHPDHTGGLDYLIKRFEVREVWDNGRLIYPEDFLAHANIEHKTFVRGDVIEGKGYSMYVFHPYSEFYTMYENEYVGANNDSLVIKIKGKNTSFLFPGDVEEEAEEDLLSLGKWLKSDVIKVPHHGGKTSAYKQFFELVDPEFAIISSGWDNSFGHPHKETLDALQKVRILRTDIDGAIQIRESEKGLEIKTYRDIQFEKTKSFKKEIENIKRVFMVW